MEAPTAEVRAAIDSLEGVSDVDITMDPRRRASLWQYRELHSQAVSTVGVPHKFDVALPPGMLGEFVAAIPSVVEEAAPGSRTWLFGHGGESCVHVNVTGVAVDDDLVDEAVMQFVVKLNGSISAEHGIGRSKRRWLHLAHTPEERRLRAGLKAVFDPHHILNPRVLLPPESV
jgi:FAD/FMN-containing dehydrogenase